ncbi:MAG: EamA family transporter [Opitutales bacterium]|nr:EamA family transporter [Opitutales bacterium]
MIYLAIVSLLWAFSFGLIGNALSGVDSFFVATVRLGCATLLFLPFLRAKEIVRGDRLRLVVIGAIQFGLMYACYMRAFHYIPSHLVAIFSILTPVYVVIIHNLRKRTFSSRYLVAALLSVLGAVAIKAKTIPTGDFWIGFGLMQAAGIAFAYGQVAYRDWKRNNPQTNDRSVFALLAMGGTACAGMSCVIFSDLNTLSIQPDQWKAILYLGCVASGLGFFLWNKGASVSNPGTLAAFNNAVVPLAVICSLFIFGESTSMNFENTFRLVIGSILIGSAVYIGQENRPPA